MNIEAQIDYFADRYRPNLLIWNYEIIINATADVKDCFQ